jgi:ribonucleotide reductase alpha subunit
LREALVLAVRPTAVSENDFHELLSNAVYEKTWENVLKRHDIHLVADAEKHSDQSISQTASAS